MLDLTTVGSCVWQEEKQKYVRERILLWRIREPGVYCGRWGVLHRYQWYHGSVVQNWRNLSMAVSFLQFWNLWGFVVDSKSTWKASMPSFWGIQVLSLLLLSYVKEPQMLGSPSPRILFFFLRLWLAILRVWLSRLAGRICSTSAMSER